MPSLRSPFSLQINGETKQDDSTGLMLYRIPELIEHVSGIMTLEEGDLLLTGLSRLSSSRPLRLFSLTLSRYDNA